MDREERDELICECMKKEIYLMRELLANMHQEEIALTMFDRAAWNIAMQERFPLVQKLSHLREKRESLSHDTAGKKMPGEKIFPFIAQDSCDVIFLSDQMITLIEKMNEQQGKNSALFTRYENIAFTPSGLPRGYGLMQPALFPTKVKATVATIPRNSP